MCQHIQMQKNTKRAGTSPNRENPARLDVELLLRRRGLASVALVEAVHASFGVDELGLPREIGMASRAGIHAHGLDGGASLQHMTTCAGNRRVVVLGMEVFFHISGFHVLGTRKLPDAKIARNLSPCLILGK